MAKTISVRLNRQSIGDAIKRLNQYKKTFPKRAKEMCKALAELGAVKVSLDYTRAVNAAVGMKPITVTVERRDNGYAIVAQGESVMFVEFGAGAMYGYGHPLAGELGMGPGTYPSDKGHWNDPKGWWIPKEAGGGHTYGNPPSMAMYETAKDLRQEVLRIAKEGLAFND